MKAGLDTREFEGMGDSRYGHVFDVFVDPGPTEGMDRYAVLVHVGLEAPSEETARKLREREQAGAVVAEVRSPADLDALQDVIPPALPMSVSGATPVLWLSAKCGGDYVVAVSNHTGEPWEGTLRLADAAGLQGAAREMTNDSELPVRTRGDELLVKLSVPPWDVQICRVS
jgi:hypothetical protein